ncbi:MAG: PKD domain-containing protein [Vicingaceae bacterium]
MKHLFLTLFSCLLFSSFLSAQTADFEDGCAPLTVNFTPPPGLSSYFWDFKDGTTSILQFPSNTFINPGSYDVELKQSAGGPTVGTITIDVFTKPSIQISADFQKGCRPLNVNLSDVTNLSPSVSVNAYNWVFGDGSTAQGEIINKTFNQSGDFDVTLELKTNLPSCDITKQFDDYINVSNRPNVSYITNPSNASACSAPLTVSFTNNSSSTHPLSYQWSMGNGSSFNTTNPPDQTYSTEGDFPVKLIAIDTNNCADSNIRIVSIGSPKINLDVPDTFCLNAPDTIFNRSSSGSVFWDFGADHTVEGYHNFRNPIIKYSTPGTKTITFNVAVGACVADTTFTVFVADASADFASSPTFACSLPYTVSFTPSASNGTFNWIFGDSSMSSQQNPSVTYPIIDESPYVIHKTEEFETTLIYTATNGCQDTIRKKDTLYRPTALMMPDRVKGCVPLTVTFSDSSFYYPTDTLEQWEWIFGDGNSTVKMDSTDVTHTYSMTGKYWAYLVVTNETGCVDTSYRTQIRVGDVMSPDFTVDLSNVCVGDSVQFNDITPAPLGDSIDTWNFNTESNRMFSCFQSSSPKWAYDRESGGQDVTMTVGFNGCYSSVNKSNLVNVSGPVAFINFKTFCDDPLSVQFYDSSLNATSVLWDFGDGTTSTATDPFHTYASTGDYTVSLQAENPGSNCPVNIQTTEINIRDIKADFSVIPEACYGVEHQFDASASVDVYENCYRGYNWTFEDSTMRPITTSSPIIRPRFFNNGFQEITLVTTDINGCLDTASKVIEVFQPLADFSIDDNTVCAPTTVNFSDLSTADTTIVGWEYRINDNDTLFTQNPSYLFDSFQPINEVMFIVKDSLGCQDTAFKNVDMYEPITNYTVNDRTVCLGDQTDFTATDFTTQGSNLNFRWVFGNGDTSFLQNPSLVYGTSGNYTVELLIEEVATACTNLYQETIDVVEYPVADFTIPNYTSKYLCQGTVQFNNTSTSVQPLQYSWDFGNGKTSVFEDPGTSYLSNGNYQVSLAVQMNQPYGCADTTTETVRIQSPQGDFLTDLHGDTICRLESVFFTLKDTVDLEYFKWEFGDGDTLANQDSVSHQYTFVPPSGQTIAKLVMSNADGSCPQTVDTIINIHEVTADFRRNNGIDTAYCFAPVQLTNLSNRATSWTWNFGDGNTQDQGNQLSYEYDSAGTYDITLAARNDNLNCNDSITKRVILFPNPDFFIVGDTLCEGETASVNSSVSEPSWTYNWSADPTSNFQGNGTASISTIPLLTTEYTLNVIDTNGCIGEDVDTVFVIPNLNLTDFDTTIVIGDRINLPVYANAGLFNFTWTPTDGLSCLDCLPPSIQPLEKVEYNLVIADKQGCFDYDVDFVVDIHPETFIKMPTTFSPNGDGVNDLIYVEGWGIKELVSYQIFNRWGELVFETNDLEEGWDGSYKGKIQNNDVYVFKVLVNTWRDEEKTLEGYINLVR